MKNSVQVLCALVLYSGFGNSELIDNTATTNNGRISLQQLNSTSETSSPLVARLRSKISELDLDSYYTSDQQLERYIESFNYNVERAAILLRKTAQWRKSSAVNNILNSPPPVLVNESLPYECTGFTEEGNPVFYIPVGRWNLLAVIRAGLGPEINKYWLRVLEVIRKSTEGRINPKTGKPVDQAVVIEDLGGFSFRSLLTIRSNHILNIARYLHNLDWYYPFLSKKYLVVRAPVILPIFWPMARKVFPRLQKNFRMYSRFSARGANDLIHTVPKRVLPIELGGTYVTHFSKRLLS